MSPLKFLVISDTTSELLNFILNFLNLSGISWLPFYMRRKSWELKRTIIVKLFVWAKNMIENVGVHYVYVVSYFYRPLWTNWLVKPAVMGRCLEVGICPRTQVCCVRPEVNDFNRLPGLFLRVEILLIV